MANYVYQGPIIDTLDKLIEEADRRFWQVIPDKKDPNRLLIFDCNSKLIGTFLAEEERIKGMAERSRMVAVQITKVGETYNVGVWVDNKPEHNYPFDHPITLSEALVFVAADHRLSGGKWDIGGASPPDDLTKV